LVQIAQEGKGGKHGGEGTTGFGGEKRRKEKSPHIRIEKEIIEGEEKARKGQSGRGRKKGRGAEMRHIGANTLKT